MTKEEYEAALQQSINEELSKQIEKEKNYKAMQSQTTVKPVLRRTYPKAVIGSDGEEKDLGSQVVYEETNLVEVSSKDYMIISSEAISYLFTVLTSTEHQRFSKIQPLTKTAFNVIFNGQYPHNSKTLKEYLGMNTKQFERFIRKLTNKGILYVIKGYSPTTRRVQNTYMVNPFISRKRKTIDKELCSIFADVQTLMNHNE